MNTQTDFERGGGVMDRNTNLIAGIRGIEARAADHRAHGRFVHARAEYREAAAHWSALVDRLEEAGEPLIAMSLRGEIEKNYRKADACIWGAA